MRIKCITSCASPDNAFSKGREYDVSKEVGEDLVRALYAVEIKTTETAKVQPIENAKKK